MLDRDYKFYLAFENSNCKEYITEKFFETSLNRNILPVVMGAPREDYVKYGPHKSFIHVDEFNSPAQIAKFLHVLDQNDDLYNSYFEWKGSGQATDEYNKQFVCEICARLHDERIMSTSSWYDVDDWWNSPGICSSGPWNWFLRQN